MMGGASGGIGGGGMAQHGMGQSMTGGGMAHFFASLDLSDKQFAEVNRIHDETRKKQWELRGKQMDEESRLRSLLYADKPDPAAVGEAYKRIADLRRQMIETCVEGHNRIADVLSTPEQKDKLKRMWREMGPAMMER
jgi:Spy/CpxP family protein refolding chaperone